MLSITQPKQGIFHASSGAKVQQTPRSKTLGRVQTFVVPCEAVSRDPSPLGVQGALLREATLLACRIAILNGETKTFEQLGNQSAAQKANGTDDEQTAMIDDEKLRRFLEHSTPVDSTETRAQIVTSDDECERAEQSAVCRPVIDDNDESKEPRETESVCLQETCRQCVGQEASSDTRVALHDWTNDDLVKYNYVMQQRAHHHIIYTHPCVQGDIKVSVPLLTHLYGTDVSKIPQAPALPTRAAFNKSATNVRALTSDQILAERSRLRRAVSMSAASFAQCKNDAEFVRELVDKISACQSQRSLAEESIESRVERARAQRIASKIAEEQRTKDEYNRLLLATKRNLLRTKAYCETNNNAAESDSDSEYETDGYVEYVEDLTASEYSYESDSESDTESTESDAEYDGEYHEQDSDSESEVEVPVRILKKKILVRREEDSENSSSESSGSEDEADLALAAEQADSPTVTVREEHCDILDDYDSGSGSGSDDAEKKVAAECVTVNQSCTDFMLAVCEPSDTFVFFKKLNCPIVLQWADEERTSIHVFRRYTINRTTWTLQSAQSVYFQLLATLHTRLSSRQLA